jgi:hypothetical protein
VPKSKYLIFLLIGAFLDVKACEPPPTLNARCKGQKIIYLGKEKSLLIKNHLLDYEKTLKKLLKKENLKLLEREGDGSCFLMNHSLIYIGGYDKNFEMLKLCREDLLLIEMFSKNFISKDSLEYNSIKNKEHKKILSKKIENFNQVLDQVKKQLNKK